MDPDFSLAAPSGVSRKWSNRPCHTSGVVVVQTGSNCTCSNPHENKTRGGVNSFCLGHEEPATRGSLHLPMICNLWGCEKSNSSTGTGVVSVERKGNIFCSWKPLDLQDISPCLCNIPVALPGTWGSWGPEDPPLVSLAPPLLPPVRERRVAACPGVGGSEG